MEELFLFLLIVTIATAAVCFAGYRRSASGSGRTEAEASSTESEAAERSRDDDGTGENVFQWWPAITGPLLCQLVLVFLFLWAAGGREVRGSLPLVLFLVAVGGTVLVVGRRRGAA